MKQIPQNEKLKYFKNLISFKDPAWLTTDKWSEHMQEFEGLQRRLENKDQFLRYLGHTIGEKLPNTYMVHPRDGYVTIPVSAIELYNMYQSERVISPPTTGQDPKKPPQNLNRTNKILKNASYHFGNFWGDEKGSLFDTNGWMNFSLFEDKNTLDIFGCVEPNDLEHRFVGGVAGLLGIVPLPDESDIHDIKLYFESPRIEGGKIQVNGLTIDDIVEESNKNLVDNEKPVTKDEVIRRYEMGRININFLPMWTPKGCQTKFAQLNSNESKTAEQMLHASSLEIIEYLKNNSSIKVHEFKGDDNYFHPLFELYSSKDKYSLRTLLDACMIHLTINNTNSSTGGMIDTSKTTIIDKIKKEEVKNKEKYQQTLDELYMVCKEFKHLNTSSQILSLLMKIFRWLDEKKKLIYDFAHFGREFEKFITDLRDSDEIMEHNLGNAKASKHIDVFNKIEIDFLKRGEDVGIYDSVKRTPRLFTKSTIDKSAKNEQYRDIDGKEFTSKPVGGHKISDYEILRSTQEQLDSIVKGTFKHENNCRAMSTYHNTRMGVLRLDEYLEIINESDETVSNLERKRYEELKKKPIIRR